MVFHHQKLKVGAVQGTEKCSGGPPACTEGTIPRRPDPVDSAFFELLGWMFPASCHSWLSFSGDTLQGLSAAQYLKPRPR